MNLQFVANVTNVSVFRVALSLISIGSRIVSILNTSAHLIVRQLDIAFFVCVCIRCSRSLVDQMNNPSIFKTVPSVKSGRFLILWHT